MNNEEEFIPEEIDYIKEAEKYDIYNEDEEKISTKTKVSITLSILSIVLIFIWPSIKTVKIPLGISTFISLFNLIFIIKNLSKLDYYKDKEKRQNRRLMLISFLELIIIGFSFIIFICLENIKFTDKYVCPYSSTTNCIKNPDGTNTCKFLNTIEIPCSKNKNTIDD